MPKQPTDSNANALPSGQTAELYVPAIPTNKHRLGRLVASSNPARAAAMMGPNPHRSTCATSAISGIAERILRDSILVGMSIRLSTIVYHQSYVLN